MYVIHTNLKFLNYSKWKWYLPWSTNSLKIKSVQSENSVISRCSFISERRASFNDQQTSFILGRSMEILFQKTVPIGLIKFKSLRYDSQTKVICPRVVKDKRPSSVQSEEDDEVPARGCCMRRTEHTCAQVTVTGNVNSSKLPEARNDIYQMISQLQVKYSENFRLTSQWFKQHSQWISLYVFISIYLVI